MTKHVAGAIVDDSHIVAAMEYSQKGEKTPSTVIDQDGDLGPVFLGGFNALLNRDFVTSSLSSVLNVAKGLEEFFPAYGRSAQHAKAAGVDLLTLEWVDSVDFPITDADMCAAVTYVHQARQKGGVLVHCAQVCTAF